LSAVIAASTATPGVVAGSVAVNWRGVAVRPTWTAFEFRVRTVDQSPQPERWHSSMITKLK
jgi:hypothetical protein